MIVRLLSLLARVLLETALMLLAVALLLGLLGYRVGRRALFDRPDRFGRTGDGLIRLVQVASALRQATDQQQEEVSAEDDNGR